MDLAKFLSILERQTLYFPSGKLLAVTDPFEGQFPDFQIERMQRLLSLPLDQVRREFETAGGGLDITDDELANMLTLFHAAHVLPFHVWFGISCWHINERESAAMWQLYSMQGQGIAIQSSADGLRRAFEQEKSDLFIGSVVYRNYDNDALDFEHPFQPLTSKRDSFAHERELRVITRISSKDGRVPEGVEVPINVHSLIEQIVVSPHFPSWVHELIKTVLGRYGWAHKPIIHSTLLTGPRLERLPVRSMTPIRGPGKS